MFLIKRFVNIIVAFVIVASITITLGTLYYKAPIPYCSVSQQKNVTQAVKPSIAKRSGNQIPNASLGTQESIKRPANWTAEAWGSNTILFHYLTAGHAGNHSLTVEVKKYSSGDGKWYFTPQPIKPITRYSFTDYYKSNVETSIVLAYTMQNNSIQYVQAGIVSPSVQWIRSYADFITPPGVKELTVYHLIQNVGYLTTGEYGLYLTTQSFNQGVVSVSFDDGWGSQYTNAFSLLKKYNYTGTFYIVPSYLNTSGYMTIEQACTVAQGGNEIGSHTLTHADLTKISATRQHDELVKSKNELNNEFGPVQNFAPPYGSYTPTITKEVEKYYSSQRTSDIGFNSIEDFNVFAINVQPVLVYTRLDTIQAWIDQAIHDKTWLVLQLHQIDTSRSMYSCTPQEFEKVLQYLHNKNTHVLTVAQALMELKPQTGRPYTHTY